MIFIFLLILCLAIVNAEINIPSVTMHNGVKFPQLGLGTWKNTNHPEAIRAALDLGYRLIDTAFVYGNEEMIGQALQDYFKSGSLTRKDVFITSKLPPFGYHPKDADAYIARQLRSLQTDYLDLYLLHFSPCAEREPGEDFPMIDGNGFIVPCNTPLIDTWRVLEKWYKNGTFKAIGLSNFNESQISSLYEKAEIKPHNYQGECHVLWPQTELINFLKKLNITFTAYAPIGSKTRNGVDFRREGDVLGQPVVKALAEKYHKTPAQILLRNHLQRGYTAIPKSSNLKHLAENLDIFDFALTSEDMQKLDDIPHLRLFLFKRAMKSPEFPFMDVIQEFGQITNLS